MPLLEGLTVGGEKNAVILDIGSAYTKCGFAGEIAPRCIIPSEVLRAKTQEVVKVYSPQNESDLYAVLVDFIHTLYFRHLLVNPKERRVVIVESLLCPSLFRNTLAKALFTHYEVPSVLFAPSHLVALFTLGIPSGLVLDCGFSETLVIPVYEGTPILKAWQALPVAGKAIHSLLAAQLMEHGTVKTDQTNERPLPSVLDTIPPNILEDIKVRTCFVTTLERAKDIAAARNEEDESKYPTPPPDVDYPLDGGNILHIKGKIREHTCEVLFEQDNEEQSIATLILEAILKCPVDIRRTLSENILLLGGTTMLPGFCHRMQVELRELLARHRYRESLCIKELKFQVPPARANYASWLGGGIFGALEILGSRSIARETFSQTGVVPDWSSLTDTDESEEKAAAKR